MTTTKPKAKPKTKAKVYKLSDFMTKDLNETATKMPLMYDDKDTGCFLMVKGIESKSVQRARITTQVGYADLAEEAEKITDKVKKAELFRDKKESLEIDLAIELVTGWSFDKTEGSEALYDLLHQNQGLAFAVIAHATTPGNYLKK